jgi:phosphatidylglycerophosphate synthase
MGDMSPPRPGPTRASLRWRDLFNVAGALTAARLPLALLFAAVLPDTRWALGVFVLAGVTDGLDGVVARRTGTTSHTGSMLDGFLDKVFLVNAAWGLAVHDLVPAWWLLPWFIRELVQLAMVPGLWMPFRQGRVFSHQATRAGKAATWAVGLSVFSVLLGVPLVATILTPAAGVFGAWAAGQYVWQEHVDRHRRGRLPDGAA